MQDSLNSWPQEARKFGLTHLLDHIVPPLAEQSVGAGQYRKLYLDECHAFRDFHEPGLKGRWSQRAAAGQTRIIGFSDLPCHELPEARLAHFSSLLREHFNKLRR